MVARDDGIDRRVLPNAETVEAEFLLVVRFVTQMGVQTFEGLAYDQRAVCFATTESVG